MIELSKKLTAELRSLAIRSSGIRCTTAKVKVVKGSQSPRMKGSSFYYRNKRGDIIRHPGAYFRKGHAIYVSSTRRVEVGELWLSKFVAKKAAVEFIKKHTKNIKKAFLKGEQSFPLTYPLVRGK